MRVSIITIGRVKDGPQRELIKRYQSRFDATGRNIGLDRLEIIELNESRASSPALRKREEASNLLKAVPNGAFAIALDENGKDLSSSEFANKIGGMLNDGRRELVLLIGGADGHGKEIAGRADIALRFGRLTWPHQLVRVMVAEQLYRSATILAGHPYHRT